VHVRQQRADHLRASRFEPALCVGEPGAVGEPDHQVVAAGDHLTAGAAHSARPGREPGPDRDVGMTVDQRDDQRQQRVQAGGQVDVEVHHHVGIAVGPGGAQGVPASLAIQMQNPYPVVGLGEFAGHPQHAIGAGIVHHSDRPLEGELITEVGPQHLQATRQRALLVVYRYHHVHRGGPPYRPARRSGLACVQYRTPDLHGLVIAGRRASKLHKTSKLPGNAGLRESDDNLGVQ
jgi:hypothetical protein